MNVLIRKARNHDKEAFVQLMKEHASGMYKVAKAILKSDEDAADAMQETVLTCWEKMDTLKKDEYFKTWMTRILINHSNAIYRKRKRLTADEYVAEEGAWDKEYESVEWREFLSCLDEKYRIVIMLYYVEGFKTKEIAEILDMNESTVRGRLAAARRKLQQQYQNV